MKNENLIHVKFEYEEALQSKKDILSLEMSLLRIAKTIKKYRYLRLQELTLKLGLSKKIKEIVIEMKKIQSTLPKLKIPKKIKESRYIKSNEATEKTKENKYYEDLEYQLQEIQEKLKVLK